MKKPLRFAMLVVALFSAATPICLLGKERHGPHWSVDLTKYGYPTQYHGAATVPISNAAVAASNNNVVLALNIEQNYSTTNDAFLNSTWQLSLLVFNVENGKLSAKCGPWRDSIWFEVWATDDGNFLLHLEPPRSERNNASPQLVLLSPTCEVLQHLPLPLPAVKGRDSSLLLSPSRHTLLISIPIAEGTERDLRDANTLAMRARWIDISRNDPQAVSVSDDGLLATKSPNSEKPGFVPVSVSYRSFAARLWHKISDVDLYNSVTFLSNEAFLTTATVGTLAPCATSRVRIVVRKIDGTLISSSVLSQHSYNIGPVSFFAVSPTGNYFGAVLRFSNEAWLWCQLDMGPEHYDAFIWSSSSGKPIAHIKMSATFSFSAPLAFAPDDSWVAMTDKGTLSLYPLGRPRAAER